VWVNDETLSQPAGSYSSFTFSTAYAGIASVSVISSTTDTTYVRVIYSVYAVNYDNQTNVYRGDIQVEFPLLPTPNVEIRIGNTNLVGNATETVTITYYY